MGVQDGQGVCPGPGQWVSSRGLTQHSGYQGKKCLKTAMAGAMLFPVHSRSLPPSVLLARKHAGSALALARVTSPSAIPARMVKVKGE